MELPRLDVLIYAHDGRGLGHVSRSVAIGLACRRLFPNLKVLLVSGSRITGDFIGPAPLDWVKLPAYETMVVQGASHGRMGPTNLSDTDLGRFRTETLTHLVTLYRPRCVLSDHLPQGKHKELRGALNVTAGTGMKWILGIRGVVGNVPGLWSDLAVSVFQAHYQAIFWYGDGHVLGLESLQRLQETFGVSPLETGYVSRPAELAHWQTNIPESNAKTAVTVSIPWIGEHTLLLMRRLARAIGRIGDRFGDWHIYVGFGDLQDSRRMIQELFHSLPFCRVSPMGSSYFHSLQRSRAALIYGGYNSLTDVLFADVPAVVLLRGMQDGEQENHIHHLNRYGAGFISLPEGQADEQTLGESLTRQLTAARSGRIRVNIQGAENAARALAQILST